MADSAHLEELRRRVQAAPASVAFADLAEEYLKTGNIEDAISTCRAGLMRHPTYVPALVTLGRALFEQQNLPAAREVLEQALQYGPENQQAMRALGDVHLRQGRVKEALALYERALQVANRQIEAAGARPPTPSAQPAAPVTAPVVRAPVAEPPASLVAPAPVAPVAEPAPPVAEPAPPVPEPAATVEEMAPPVLKMSPAVDPEPEFPVAHEPAAALPPEPDSPLVAELERFLAAIEITRERSRH